MALRLVFSCFAKALGQMENLRFRRAFWLGVLLTFALLVAAYAAFLWLINSTEGPDALTEILGDLDHLHDLFSLSSLIFMLVLSFFLMIPVASLITSMFLDEVADAVEARDYPDRAPARRASFGAALVDTVVFLGLLIFANLVAFIVYAFLPYLAPVLFILLNGYLLGREYFHLAAMRHIGRDGARKLRKRHFGTVWAAGALMTLPLVVPVLNLFIPILGAATFTHIFNALDTR